jgi:2-oxoglutarate ferredoxin oxidoreductase subunit delta
MVKKTGGRKKRTDEKSGPKTKAKAKAKKGYIITIIKDRCKGCKLCVTFCPTGTLKMSKKTNQKGYFLPHVVDISSCKGCELCFKYCPDFAIYCTEKTGKN